MLKSLLLASCVCVALSACQEKDRPGASLASEPPPESSQLTASDQSNRPEDVKLTQQIRKRLTDDGALSFDAKNITVITIDGNVVLRGRVASDAERETVAKHAHEVAGDTRVEVLLEGPEAPRPENVK